VGVAVEFAGKVGAEVEFAGTVGEAVVGAAVGAGVVALA